MMWFVFLSSNQIPKIRCVPCPRETRASSVSKIAKENVSSVYSTEYGFKFIVSAFNLLSSTVLLCCSYIIQKQKDPSKAHQMKLEVIIRALKWLEIDMDLDEVHFSPPVSMPASIHTSRSIYTCKLLVRLCRWSALWPSWYTRTS